MLKVDEPQIPQKRKEIKIYISGVKDSLYNY